MTPEEHIKSVSELIDDLDIKRDAYKAAQLKWYRAIDEALDDGIPAHILAEVCDCSRQTIYDSRKRLAVLLRDITKANERLRAQIAKESIPDSSS